MTFEPGWHVDPRDPHREREWDGAAWTGEERPARGLPVESEKLRIQRRPDVSTRAIAVIAWSPFWVLAIGIMLRLFSFAPGLGGAFAGFLALAFIATVIAAFRDRHVLAHRGVVAPATPLWALLGPLSYLLARRSALRVVPHHTGSPLVLFLVGLALDVGVVFFLAVTPGVMLPVLRGGFE